MIGVSIALGVQHGWLNADEWGGVLARAWTGISDGIDEKGGVSRVCVGTGPLDSLNEYLIRDAVTGLDDRGARWRFGLQSKWSNRVVITHQSIRSRKFETFGNYTETMRRETTRR